MSNPSLATRIRAAARNALLWGAGFGAAAFAVMSAAVLVGAAPDGIGILDALGMAIRVSFWGGVCGLVFSAALRLGFTGRRLAEIRFWPFTIGTAVGIGVFVPLALQALNVLGGEGAIAWNLVVDDGIRTGLFGGAAAAVTLKLAQLADRALPPGVRSEEERLLRNADIAIAAAEQARTRETTR